VSRSGDGAGRIAAWWLGPVPVHAMVLNRLVLGGVVFCHALSRAPEFGVLFGSGASAWSAPYREFVTRFLAPDLGGPLVGAVSALAQLPPGPRQIVVEGLYAALLVASLAFALGLFTRWAGAAALLIHLFFVGVHPLAHYGWATLVVPFGIYVVLSRAGDYASLDAWRRARRGRAPPPPELPAWPQRLLMVHVAAMYFFAGFARIDDPDWLAGQVLFEALSRALFTRFDLDLQPWKPALLLLSRAVFLLEPAASLGLWIPRLRTLFALALIAMHLILEVLTNVGWWNFIMIGGLLTFLPPAWLRPLLPRIPAGAGVALESPSRRT
jgi:hypothetical protein